jgi:hypothetical protein
VRHVPDGVLRRLDDEPLAVPDRLADHVADCERCSARRALVARDADRAARLLSVPPAVADTDLAWARLRRELQRDREHGPRRPTPVRWPHARFPSVSLRTGLAAGAVGFVIAGTAAAATLTTIFEPTHVAPVSVSQNDLRAITSLIGSGDGRVLGGFPTPSGRTAARFGAITWASQPPRPVSSLSQAEAQSGLALKLPTRLPAGVGGIQQFAVQPHVTATVTFNSAAGGLDGSSVTLDAGPGVLAAYGAGTARDVPTLAVATMRRPTAVSRGASLSQVEAFLLSRPGIPPELAEEVRLLGDLRTILPVPVPSGVSVRSVQIAGWPGVVLADSSNAAAAAVWEDGGGVLHVVAGLLDSHDVLNVADQLG